MQRAVGICEQQSYIWEFCFILDSKLLAHDEKVVAKYVLDIVDLCICIYILISIEFWSTSLADQV